MKRMTRDRIGIVTLTLGVASVALAQSGRTLILNGKVASRDVRVIGGRAYVPVADVAKALGQEVAQTPAGYEIRTAGGANQVEGLRGKIGDMLFDGKWRFQVKSVQEMDAFTMATNAYNDYAIYSTTAELNETTLRPKPGQTLIVVACLLKNGLMKQNQALWRVNNDTHTALADDQGRSYPPIAFDIEETAHFVTKPLLPGASMEFNVLFTVPRGTRLKDLVFTLRTLNDMGSDVRVSLTP
jgi:hypothetical protein